MNALRRLTFLVIFCILLQLDNVSAAIITVTNTNDSGAGSLRDAIATAASGDTVNFNLSGCPCTIVTASEFSIANKSLLIQGPGATQLTISGNNAHRIFSFAGSSGGTTISDLTITNGSFSGSPGGGAIFVASSAVFAPVTISNCVLNNNTATTMNAYGGAIHVASGSGLSVVNCTLSNNSAGAGGGAIATAPSLSFEATIAIFNSTITNNTAAGAGGVYAAGNSSLTSFASNYTNNTAGDGGGLGLGGNSVIRGGVIDGNHLNNSLFRGGGIDNSGTLDLSGVSVSNNDAGTTNDGGGIANTGTLTLSQCTISGNHAGRGGGIYSNDTLVVSESTIADNMALGTVQPRVGGGGIYHSTGTAAITACTISGNKTNNDGGGIVNSGGTMTLTTSTVSTNQVSPSAGAVGGGIHGATGSSASNTSLTSCTIALNTASLGGGIRADAGNTVTVNTTLIGSNTAPSAPDISGMFTSNGYNFIGNNGGSTNQGFTNGFKSDIVGGRGNPPIDPLLVALADNGGLTKTNGLQAASPVIDKGNSPFGITTDQRGFPRCNDAPASANLPGGNFSDIGAFEYADSTLRITAVLHPASNHFVLQGIGLPNAVHSVQAAPNPNSGSFVTIAPILSDLTGHLQFDDPDAVGLGNRFYRISFP